MSVPTNKTTEVTYYCFYCERIIEADEDLYVYAPHGDIVCRDCDPKYGDQE